MFFILQRGWISLNFYIYSIVIMNKSKLNNTWTYEKKYKEEFLYSTSYFEIKTSKNFKLMITRTQSSSNCN